ncbi:MAG: twin-arginine translocase subunit TatC [Candidatus Binatia bacterium]
MPDVKMPLTAHLEELRWRLIKSLLAIAVAFAALYNFADVLFEVLTRPLLALHEGPVEIIGTGVTEAFFTKLKVSFIAAVFIASPVLFYQAWMFVAPGLYDQEKRYARPFVFFATLFFLLGAGFCYEVVFPVGYQFFLAEYAAIGVTPNIRISEYLSFSARMLFAFGMTFELPVVTFFLARIGLVTHQTMLRYLRYAILAIFVLAAVLTPGPDIASQLLMAGPLLLLYVLSIGVAYVFAKPRATTEVGSVAET